MVGMKARWLVEGVCGLPRIQQGNALIYVSVSSIATILDTLAVVLGMYHALLDIADAFAFVCHTWPLSHKINLVWLHMVGGTVDLSSASLRLPIHKAVRW